VLYDSDPSESSRWREEPGRVRFSGERVGPTGPALPRVPGIGRVSSAGIDDTRDAFSVRSEGPDTVSDDPYVRIIATTHKGRVPMTGTHIRRYLAFVGAAALVAAACSSGASDAGSTATAGDAGVTTTTVDGSSGQQEVQVGGEVPADFALPIPDGGTVTSFVDDQTVTNLNMLFDGDRVAEFVAFYQQWIDDNATEIVFENASSDSAQWVVKYGTDEQASIGITAAKDNDGNVTDTVLQLSP
jgi:hypothetical protein